MDHLKKVVVIAALLTVPIVWGCGGEQVCVDCAPGLRRFQR
ncbi:MAG TPA: hypothetical protein PLY68_10685 [Myxococcota bacterium]|nr:hypothetical protein [Myxococcota bacterium]HPB51715.1 hypothetical protein [Myxococcota bacterium]HQP96644.1 hypothetical protein [Myxococcota bacterium]